MIKADQTIEASDLVLGLTAGEALSARDAVYISTSDGKVYKCDADDAAKIDFVGFAQEAASTDGAVNVVHDGHLGGFSSLTIGAPYYVSGTAGGITATAPTNKVQVGIAVSATIVRIDRGASRTQTFIADGTWTKPSYGAWAFVEMWGAGGSGGAANDGTGNLSHASGGAGGEHRAFLVPLGILGSTVAVTVGTGGPAATVGSEQAASGTAGEDTTFGSIATAKGGAAGTGQINSPGGALGNTTGGTGGTSPGYDDKKNENGGYGGGANWNTDTATAGESKAYGGCGGGGAFYDGNADGPGPGAGGAGGTSTYGYGGNGGAGAYGGNATAGSIPGGGGGGVSQGATSGAGANGMVRVTVL